MNTRERHFRLDGTYSLGTVHLTVEGMKGLSCWLYRTTEGPYKRLRNGEFWTAGNVQDAKNEAHYTLQRWGHDWEKEYALRDGPDTEY